MNTLFYKLLKQFEKAGALKSIILIGGWAYEIYRHYFENPPQLPLLRTADIDFLIPRPPEKKTLHIDLANLLFQQGFERHVSPVTGYEVFLHPDMDVEFLIPDLGKGSSKAVLVKQLGIKGQPLRFLDILQRNPLSVEYHKVKILVPQPSFFVFNKMLISGRRAGKFKAKALSDLQSGCALAEYLCSVPDQRKIFLNELNHLPPKQFKTVKTLLLSNSSIDFN